jgi:hypothetical protein
MKMICVDASEKAGQLTLYKVYNTGISNRKGYISVEDDVAYLLNSRYDCFLRTHEYESKRFMRIDEWRDKQLNVLL